MHVPDFKEQRRFWAKVDTSDINGCWLWKGADDGRGGYGKFRVAGRSVRCIRWVLALYSGAPVDPGHYVLHLCDRPRCVRPDHLVADTPTANARDRQAKGRGTIGERASKFGPRVKAEWVPKIRDFLTMGLTPGSIAKQFGVSRGAINAIKEGRTWKHVR